MTPYREVAKAALINWNGLSEEEATKIASTESIENLEGQVYAMSSVKSAAQRLAYYLLLNDEQAKEFEDAVINGPENAPIFAVASKTAQQLELKEVVALSSLSHIHDNWVKDNSSEKAFEKKKERGQLRQYLPLELIGFNEVKSDLLFLNPILKSVGLSIDENKLQETYNSSVKDFLTKNGTDIKKIIETYPALSEEMKGRLIPLADVVMEQAQANWDKNDGQSFSTFLEYYVQSLRAENTRNFPLPPTPKPTLTEPEMPPEEFGPQPEPQPEPTPEIEGMDVSNLSMEELISLANGTLPSRQENNINPRTR